MGTSKSAAQSSRSKLRLSSLPTTSTRDSESDAILAPSSPSSRQPRRIPALYFRRVVRAWAPADGEETWHLSLPFFSLAKGARYEVVQDAGLHRGLPGLSTLFGEYDRLLVVRDDADEVGRALANHVEHEEAATGMRDAEISLPGSDADVLRGAVPPDSSAGGLRSSGAKSSMFPQRRLPVPVPLFPGHACAVLAKVEKSKCENEGDIPPIVPPPLAGDLPYTPLWRTMGSSSSSSSGSSGKKSTNSTSSRKSRMNQRHTESSMSHEEAVAITACPPSTDQKRTNRLFALRRLRRGRWDDQVVDAADVLAGASARG
ncbi:hypothetical protein FA95DRAFT_226443 [Auriscalpium vulgare]|uniref:Uncharacterized protein n=1 Tax=Auriscalpium vulgare TaxID=40419 RepID=A0ACB8RK81_9AGAM|nr:hypothetical protein FA95DRAFT_226443 [Auriscalpium vulgare]